MLCSLFIAFRKKQRMWDLNDSPDQRKDYESEGCSSLKTSMDGDDEKGKRVGSVSNSSSSAVIIEDGSEEEEGSRTMKKRSSKIFGFSVTHDDESMDSENPPVTRQFFPVDESEMAALSAGGGGGVGGSSSFPRAHWVGVKFCQSEALGAGKSVEVSQPMKKSRRGPRSRSSQYRGVTFYRRTGRWESHIWLVFCVLHLITDVNHESTCVCVFFFPLILLHSNFDSFGLCLFVLDTAGIVENKCIWVSTCYDKKRLHMW